LKLVDSSGFRFAHETHGNRRYGDIFLECGDPAGAGRGTAFLPFFNRKEHKDRKDQLPNAVISDQGGGSLFFVFYAFFVVKILNPRQSAQSVAKGCQSSFNIPIFQSTCALSISSISEYNITEREVAQVKL
jgi:hypothetical protein